MVIMDKKSEVMDNKKILQKLKKLRSLDYYHDLPTHTAQSSITTHFLEEKMFEEIWQGSRSHITWPAG
jgi:hypothetical protein